MRDLIDRKALLDWMDQFSAALAKSDDISASYINGYRAAMRGVREAVQPSTALSDAEEYALNMKAVAEGLLREIPYGVSDAADDAYASAEAMLEETNEFLAKMGVKEDA